jgi:ATP-dependent DNA helicase RecQ
VIIDLEVGSDDSITAVGALRGNTELKIPDVASSASALRHLDTFGEGADFVVGHNIVAHDRLFVEKHLPRSRLLDLPVVDTLYLAPLAKPQIPYHRLVKDYKLVSAEQSDPLADCWLTRQLLEDCWTALKRWGNEKPWLLSFYRTCFDDSDGEDGTSDLRLEGTGRFIEALGGRKLSRDRLVGGFHHFAAGKACPEAVRRPIRELLDRPATRPAVAYALAWTMVAGTGSVLPRWVHHRFPAASWLVRKARATPCGNPRCVYCSEHHSLDGKLDKYFDFPGFRDDPKTADGESLQRRIVERGAEGTPLLAVMPTGGGKSLGYQLPALIRNEQTGALTVVISPLQALMKDQVDNLNRKTRSTALAATLNGLLTMPERHDVLEGVRLGRYALLYVSPEQLRNSSFRKTIRQREIGAWVFDEAHCISKWGHDFRPDYLYAARFIREFSEGEGVEIAPVACFTATARQDVREEIVGHFRKELGQDVEVIAGDRLDRDNLHYSVEEIPTSRKVHRIDELLAERIGDPPRGAAIIYASSRRGTEELAAQLRQRGWHAEHFHAGLDPPDKKRVQDAFISGEAPVIVATNAFGMGIDKEDVRIVVHADVPGSLENYLQEAGRAGRDGEPAHCVLLFTKGDLERQFELASRDRLTKRDISQILRAIRRVRRKGVDEIVVAPGELLRVPDTDISFDARDHGASTKVKVAISWLERARFVLRDENRTRVFQGAPAVPDRETAQVKMEGLNLSKSIRGRWGQVLDLLHNADLRDGIDIDRLASLPYFRWRFRDLRSRFGEDIAGLNRAATREIFRTLYEMSRAGLLESGTYLSAWVRHKTKTQSWKLLEKIHKAQMELLGLLRAEEDDVGAGDELDISIPRLQVRLRAKRAEEAERAEKANLTNLTNDSLLRLLAGWAREGLGRQAPITLRNEGRAGMRLGLQVGWDELGELLELRTEVGRVILEALGEKADQQQLTGERLILFSLEDLGKAIDGRVGLAQRLVDPFDAIEKTLLFLDEHHVIRLQHGLAIFRQAMTVRMHDEAKGRRYANTDYRRLQEHYEGRVFQIHAIGRYVKEAGESPDGRARRYVDDYFEMEAEAFKRRYFGDARKTLARATSRESYTEIVESLGNDAQERVVTAPKERNLMVLAGPGSGKTRVVVHRCAYLLRVERVRPQSILVICFNRSAMYELRRRLRLLVGDLARQVAVHTYHSLAMRLTEQSVAALRMEGDGSAQIEFDGIIEEANRRLRGDDLLMGVAPDDLRDRLLSGFEYVLVDEYQDIDARQYEMITHIARRAGSDEDEDRFAAILAVGDDDQNIYEFRHTNVRFLRRFEEEFAAERHYLVENYRSTRHIIDVSNDLILHNRDRMKADHPIRIDNRRADAPPGGRWQLLDRRARGRVVLLDARDAGSEAAVVLAEIERLRRLDEYPDWGDFAVLGRTHRQLAGARAFLESKGVPVRRAIANGLPWPGRIREFRQLLDYLEELRAEEISVPELRMRLRGVWGIKSDWTAMADAMLAEVEGATGPHPCSAPDLIEAIHRALSEHARSHIVGTGVLAGTVHAAKGLEFRHVVVLGGEWQGRYRDGRQDSPEQKRRLYYVAMTRARETLTLLNRRDDPIPYLDDLRRPGLVRRRVAVAPGAPASNAAGLSYTVLGMEDIFLDLAGRQHEKHPIHRSLARLRAKDTLRLDRNRDGRVRLLDPDGVEVARLSSAAADRWQRPQLEGVDEVRVLAMVYRRAEDSKPDFRKHVIVPSWEVPILEVRHHLVPGGSGGSRPVSGVVAADGKHRERVGVIRSQGETVKERRRPGPKR